MAKEYDYDEEFRRLGYSASITGSSAAAETELAKIAKQATTVFMCKPGLRDCGASIVASVIGPKVVYPLAFAKARKKAVSKRLSQAMAACSDVRLGWRRAFRRRCSRARRSLMGLAHCD